MKYILFFMVHVWTHCLGLKIVHRKWWVLRRDLMEVSNEAGVLEAVPNIRNCKGRRTEPPRNALIR